MTVIDMVGIKYARLNMECTGGTLTSPVESPAGAARRTGLSTLQPLRPGTRFVPVHRPVIQLIDVAGQAFLLPRTNGVWRTGPTVPCDIEASSSGKVGVTGGRSRLSAVLKVPMRRWRLTGLICRQRMGAEWLPRYRRACEHHGPPARR